MKRKQSGFEDGIGSANKKRHVILIQETAPAAIGDGKKKNVVVKGFDWSGVELSSTAKEAYELLKRAMNSVCPAYYASFRGCRSPWSNLRMVYLRE